MCLMALSFAYECSSRSIDTQLQVTYVRDCGIHIHMCKRDKDAQMMGAHCEFPFSLVRSIHAQTTISLWRANLRDYLPIRMRSILLSATDIMLGPHSFISRYLSSDG